MNPLSKIIAGFTGLALTAATVLAQENSSDQTTSSNPYSGQSYGNQSSGTQEYGTTGSEWGTQRSTQSQPYQNQGYNHQRTGNQYGQYGQYGNQSAWGQQNSTQRGWNQSRQQGQTSQFSNAKQLLGQEVNDQEGQTVGQIKDLAVNTQNGEVFAVVGLGNSQNALVPVQALNVTGSRSNPQVTLNKTKQELQNGPVVQNNRWIQALNNPGFTQRIYSHYGLQVQPGTELGVVIVQPLPQGGTSESGSLSGRSSGSSTGTSNSSSTSNPKYSPQQGNGAYQQENGVESIPQ